MAHEPQEPPHDILAAEEFALGDADPVLHTEHEKPHDVLAVDEYGMPAPDPRLHHEPPHDVLSAEEYAMGDADPVLHHHGPVTLPGDPTGIAEPHDVLAAEEFAMPAGHAHATDLDTTGGLDWSRTRRVLVAAGLALFAAKLLRRRRS